MEGQTRQAVSAEPWAGIHRVFRDRLPHRQQARHPPYAVQPETPPRGAPALEAGRFRKRHPARAAATVIGRREPGPQGHGDGKAVVTAREQGPPRTVRATNQAGPNDPQVNTGSDIGSGKGRGEPKTHARPPRQEAVPDRATLPRHGQTRQTSLVTVRPRVTRSQQGAAERRQIRTTWLSSPPE